jgi:hypothetical protein
MLCNTASKSWRPEKLLENFIKAVPDEISLNNFTSGDFADSGGSND